VGTFGKRRPHRRLGLLLLLVCGCTLSDGSWFGPKPPNNGHPDPTVPLNLSPVPHPPPGMVRSAHSAHDNTYDQASILSQQLAAKDDEHKVLLQRLQQMEDKLFDKEQALHAASKETHAALDEVERCRKEMQHWQQEIGSLRGRLRTLEKEDRKSLESIIQTLEQLWERQKKLEPKKLEKDPPLLP
jgi:predicted  nucleic acid-binding Zn-ribbon protein